MKPILAIGCLSVFFSYNLYAQQPIQPGYAAFDLFRNEIPHGKIDTILYASKTVGTNRKALVYTPPGYSKSKTYPVLYLLHGIGGDEMEWYKGGRPDIMLDNLAVENLVEPMLVVMPNGRAMKAGGYYSSLNAVSPEVEGYYYTWTWEELK